MKVSKKSPWHVIAISLIAACVLAGVAVAAGFTPITTDSKDPVTVNLNNETAQYIKLITATVKIFTDNEASAKSGDYTKDALTINAENAIASFMGWQATSVDIFGNIRFNLNSGKIGWQGGEQKQTICGGGDSFSATGYSKSSGTVYGNADSYFGVAGAANNKLYATGLLFGAGDGTVMGNTSVTVNSGMYGEAAVDASEYDNNDEDLFLYLIAGPAYNGDLRGNSLLTINGGEFKGTAMIGGCYAYSYRTTISKDIVIDIRKPVMKGSSSVVINGGNITGLYWGIIGGCAVNGSEAETEGMIQGNSSVSIYGGTISANIYGGPYAAKTVIKSSVVRGNASVNIIGDDGFAAITAPVKIFAGADPAKTNSGVGCNATVNFENITKTPDGFKGFELNGGKSVTSGDSVLVFNTVKADFSQVTIKEFNRVEVDPNSEISGLSKAVFDADTIKLTGNWNNLGKAAPLKFTDDASAVKIDASEALGVKSAKWSDDGKTLVVKCENTPVAVTPVTLRLEIGKSGKVTATTYANNETVKWSSSDPTVAAVDDNGNVTAVKAGLTVVSATGAASETKAGCTVTVTDPEKRDPVPSPEPVAVETVAAADNPVTKDKGVPETVKPATPVITQATAENTTALAKSADVKEEFFAATADGNITVDPVIAKNAVKTVISDDATVDPKTIVTLPVITAAVESGKVAALAMKATGKQLGGVENNVVSDITLIKILKDETGAKFDYTADPALYDDRSFTLKNADGNNLALTDKIDPAATYTLILFVKDNEKFDYDKTEGSVIDPVAIAMNEAATPAPGGSSSSGCNGGFGALALLGLAIIPAIRKRNK